MDGNAVVCPLKHLCVRVDPAVEHGGGLHRERGADRLAQRLRVEAHGVLLRFPLRLELALGRICVLTERQRLRLHDHALRQQPRAEQQLLRLLRRDRLQLHAGHEQHRFERFVLIVVALHLAVLRKRHGKTQRPQGVFIVQISNLQICGSLQDGLAPDQPLLLHDRREQTADQPCDLRPAVRQVQLLADLKRALGKLHRRIRLIGLRFQLQAGGRILEDAHALRLRLIAVRLNQNAHAQEHLARVDQAAVCAADAAAYERLRLFMQIGVL